MRFLVLLLFNFPFVFLIRLLFHSLFFFIPAVYLSGCVLIFVKSVNESDVEGVGHRRRDET